MVVPVHNEQGAIANLISDIHRSLASRFGDNWEVVVVDDGSSDSTIDRICEVTRHCQNVALLRHPIRRGQSAALLTGLNASQGRIVATIDGDGQLRAEDILRLYDQLTPDVDVVLANRCNRVLSPWRRVISVLGNCFLKTANHLNFRDTGCSLRVFRREVICDLIAFDGMHRFLPTLFEMAGRRIKTFDVQEWQRRSGTSHYGVINRLPVVFDCLCIWWLRRRSLPSKNVVVPEKSALYGCRTESGLEQSHAVGNDHPTRGKCHFENTWTYGVREP